ncbi:MAG: F0F1 ATP synthase subunit gamma [Acidimicrobiia bacterium]|nr:F0F1 ATP synthase subunit gamma [Acidimicrobiia bacterium]
MASAELRLIYRRIRSVQSTMKITRAMELISTARIGKAQSRLVAARPYAAKLDEVIRNVAGAGGASHPLFDVREVRTAGVVVVSSDRGLAGGYNGAVIRLGEHRIREHLNEGRRVNVYVVGKKAQSYFSYRRHEIEHAWLNVTDLPVYADARMIANVLLNDYAEGSVDSVEVFTTRYVSALTQMPIHRTLLPIVAPENQGDEPSTPIGYSFEPSPEEILNRLLPRYLEGSIFGILLDASASEHAARRRAMKAATENAEELTRILTRGANQARQAEITTEISEIVGGAVALGDG